MRAAHSAAGPSAVIPQAMPRDAPQRRHSFFGVRDGLQRVQYAAGNAALRERGQHRRTQRAAGMERHAAHSSRSQHPSHRGDGLVGNRDEDTGSHSGKGGVGGRHRLQTPRPGGHGRDRGSRSQLPVHRPPEAGAQERGRVYPLRRCRSVHCLDRPSAFIVTRIPARDPAGPAERRQPDAPAVILTILWVCVPTRPR